MVSGDEPTSGRDSGRLNLLGAFGLEWERSSVDLPPAAQRVLTALALQGGAAHRQRLAGLLWPDQSGERALSNLRSAMFRFPEAARPVVERHGHAMRLHPGMAVDLDRATDLARRLLAAPDGSPSPALSDRGLLALDLLPSEDEPWLVVPREQHRQLRLHALEFLAESDLREQRPLDAVDTALAAVAAEPLRESAQQLVVRAHLLAGNRAAALDHFERFRLLLDDELGVPPSPQLCQLVAGIRASV